MIERYTVDIKDRKKIEVTGFIMLTKLMLYLKLTGNKELIKNLLIILLALYMDVPPDNFNNIGLPLNKLSPQDKDIQTNIRFAQLNIVDRVPEPKRSFFENFLWSVHSAFSLGPQLKTLFIFLLILSLCFAFGLFVSHNIRLWLIYLGSFCSPILYLCKRFVVKIRSGCVLTMRFS